MFRQLLVGSGISLFNIAIHAVVMTSIVRLARDIGTAKTIDPRLHPSWLLTAVMVPIVSVLMIVHFLEVSVWALTYLFVDATPAGHDVLYFAFVNYTTLGYGDITPVKHWNLLGPLTAMNGVLLFGWSTAFIYAVLRRVLAHIIPDIGTK
jgi:hypothetical protein